MNATRCLLLILAVGMATPAAATAAAASPAPPAEADGVSCRAAVAYQGPPLHAPIALPVIDGALPARFDGAQLDSAQLDSAQLDKGRFDTATVDRLRHALEAARKATAATSITAAVAMPGKGAWTEDAPDAPLHWWASAGKTFTAIVILQLAEEGRLRLDEKVAKWIEGVPNGEAITVEQLLAHTSGLFSANEDLRVRKAHRYHSPAENLAVARKHGALFCPGERWRYSNTGYDLLGEIIARVDGRPFQTAITARIITPLGLTRTRALTPNEAARDVAPLTSSKERPINPSWPGPAGAIVGPASDMVRFWHALLSNRILKPASLQRMFATLYPMFTPEQFYGLGVMLFEVADADGPTRQWLGHAGGAPGGSAMVAYSPSDHAFVAVALTGDGSSAAAANLLLRTLRQSGATASLCRPEGEVATGADVLPAVPTRETAAAGLDWRRYLPRGLDPPSRMATSISFRVDEAGSVTSVCIEPSLGETMDAAVRRAVLAQKFWSATQGGRPVASRASRRLDVAETLAPSRPPMAPTPIRAAETIAGLERIVLAPDEEARELIPRPWIAGLKHERIRAYARLGDIGSADSLAALRRIHAALARVTPAPATVEPTPWIHPALHFGDAEVRPLAESRAPDGLFVTIVPGQLLGARDLFLLSTRTPLQRDSWRRPLLLPVRFAGVVRDGAITWQSRDRFTLRYAEVRPPSDLGVARSVTMNLTDITRDQDEDGWTDLEEARLGLDPRRADTDGDFIVDGHDTCPNAGPAAADIASDTRAIIQRALFALYSIGRSRTVLLVERGMERVDVPGYGGPILYEVDRNPWLMRHGVGGVFVSWRFVRQEPTSAAIELVDWEGNLAASGQRFELRKIDGQWVVVRHAGSWIS